MRPVGRELTPFGSPPIQPAMAFRPDRKGGYLKSAGPPWWSLEVRREPSPVRSDRRRLETEEDPCLVFRTKQGNAVEVEVDLRIVRALGRHVDRPERARQPVACDRASEPPHILSADAIVNELGPRVVH